MPRHPTPDPLHPKPKRKSPPHEFFLEALTPLNPEIRHMFGGYSVYIGDKIVCMLRNNEKSPQDNGIWLVFAELTDPSDKKLRKEFPSLRKIDLLEGKIGHWRLIPSDSPHFESDALHAAGLLLTHDPRLPNPRIPQIQDPQKTGSKTLTPTHRPAIH